MVLHVSGTLHDHVEAVRAIRSDSRVFRRPGLRRLVADRLYYHRDCVMQESKSFFFRRRIRFVKFPRTVTDVSRVRDLRTNVIVQVSGQMQDEVTKSVSEGEGLLPELRFGEAGRQFIHPREVAGVAAAKNNREGFILTGHVLPHTIRGRGRPRHIVTVTLFWLHSAGLDHAGRFLFHFLGLIVRSKRLD